MRSESSVRALSGILRARGLKIKLCAEPDSNSARPERQNAFGICSGNKRIITYHFLFKYYANVVLLVQTVAIFR